MIVKAPEEDYWGGLNQMMKYINRTLGVNLNLRADSLSVIKLWLDASFATHNDFWGHTGGMMPIGEGDIASGSWKQMINRQSSTNNELIEVTDMVVPVFWTLYFIQGQG